MAFTSFYGGRQGASFIIRERFDAISVPDNTVYKQVQYAIWPDANTVIYKVIRIEDSDSQYHYEFIERTSENYGEYAWHWTELNGGNVQGKVEESDEPEPISLGIAYQKGMVQCFSKGGDSTNIVNYGEYVIIDTNSKENPDNGKVFRRGMNYDISEQNPLAGAEYIGQIVGPRGEVTELGIDHYENIDQLPEKHTGSYDITNTDLVPGEYIEGETISYDVVTPTGEENPKELNWYELIGSDYILTEDTEVNNEKTYYIKVITPIVKYNDNIKYIYCNVRDTFGNIIGCKIGFRIPYFVLDLLTAFRTPYYEEGDIIPPGKKAGERLPEDFNIIERIDDMSHPFYEKWKIHFPQGIKGDSIVLFQEYPTKAREGAIIYSDPELTQRLQQPAAGTESVKVEDYNPANSYIPIIKEGNIYYISINDGWKEKLRYKKVVYDNKADGVESFIDIGDYNIIKDITLTEDGQFTVKYTNKEDYKTTLKTIIDTRIDTKGSGSLEGDGSQYLQIMYSADPTETPEWTNIGEPINYIIDTICVDPKTVPGIESDDPLNGHLLVYYSDPERRVGPYADRSFYSKVLQTNVTGWVELGDVRGTSSANLIFKTYDSYAQLDADATILDQGASYYAYEEAVVDSSDNPQALGLYVKVNDNYVLTTDTTPVSGTTYYEKVKQHLSPEEIMGKNSASPVSLWEANHTYSRGDIVAYEESLYYYKDETASQDASFDPTKWLDISDTRYKGWFAQFPENGVQYIIAYDYAKRTWDENNKVSIGQSISGDDPTKIISENFSGLLINGFHVKSGTRIVDKGVGSRIVTELNKKTGNGSSDIDSFNIGPEVRYVGAQRNSNNYNLEEELILGTGYHREPDQDVTDPDTGEVIGVKEIYYFYDNGEQTPPNTYYILERTIAEKPLKTVSQQITGNDPTNKTLVLTFGIARNAIEEETLKVHRNGSDDVTISTKTYDTNGCSITHTP